MKKKLFLALLFCLLLVGQAVASQATKTLVDGIVLSDVVTSATGTDYLGDADKAAFFVTYDETDANAALSLAITCQISWDNSTWLSASFYDYAGTETLQTSETLTGDINYYFWFNQNLTVPYVKVILTPTGHDSTHTALVSVYSIKKQ